MNFHEDEYFHEGDWNSQNRSKTERHSESSQTSKMELFAKTVNSWKLLHIFPKSFTLDVWLGPQ